MAPARVFADFTDPVAAQALPQAHTLAVFGRECTLLGCVILHSAYRSYLRPASWEKSTLSVCYKVELSGEATRILYARIFLESHSSGVWAAWNQGGCAGARYVPALDMIVWHFPADPVLPQIGAMLAPDSLRHLPYEALPADAQLIQDPESPNVELVSYVPEKSCIARYTLTSASKGSAKSDAPIVYGKTYCGERAREVAQRQASLWALRRDDTAFQMAQPLGYSSALGVFWQRGVEGRALACVADDSNYVHYLTQVGRGLAYLHGIELSGITALSNRTLAVECIKKIDKLIAAHPSGKGRLEALRAKVLRAPTPGTPRLIYGDFHIGQLLADAERVCFLDLDSLVIGEPEQDFGEFIVALLFARVATDRVRTMASTLLGAYAPSAAWRLSMERIHWHAHLQFVTRAHRFYRELRPGWSTALQRCLEELNLDQVLAGATT
jgi:hypothetical protein